MCLHSDRLGFKTSKTKLLEMICVSSPIDVTGLCKGNSLYILLSINSDQSGLCKP